MQNYNFTPHCATIRKVAGSTPDGITGIFHWHNPSARNVALRSTQPLTEISTRDTSWGGRGGWCKGDRCARLTMLPLSCAECLEILGASTSWSPKGKSRPFTILPAVLFRCETRLISRNGYGLRKFDNRMLRGISGRTKKEVGGGQTKPHKYMSFIKWMLCQISRRSHTQGWNT